MLCVGASRQSLKQKNDCLQMIELFKAADKYDIYGLLQECVSHLRGLTGASEIAPLLQVSSLLCSCPRNALLRCGSSIGL